MLLGVTLPFFILDALLHTLHGVNVSCSPAQAGLKLSV